MKWRGILLLRQVRKFTWKRLVLPGCLAGGLFGGKFTNKVFYEIDPTTNKVTLDVDGQATSVISGNL